MFILSQFALLLYTRLYTLDYLKSHNKFYEEVFISKGLSNNQMLRFSEMKPVREENLEIVPERIIGNKPPLK